MKKLTAPLDLSLEDLANGIHNQENSGFALRKFVISDDGKDNLIFFEGGQVPLQPIELLILDALPPDAVGARKEAQEKHDSLRANGGGVCCWGPFSIEDTLRYVLAFRGTGTAGHVEPLVARAVAEWEWFGRQENDLSGHQITKGKSEESDDGSERVRQYWITGVKNFQYCGKDRGQPWSAAFISFLMRTAGAGSRFKYSAAHCDYIHAAIQARTDNDLAYGFWGYPLDERSPQVGDLICAWRTSDDFKGPVTFADARAGKDYPSHCDLVVARTDTEITTIGGNVGQSVTKKHYRLDGPQKLLTPANFAQGFAILENRLDLAPPAVKEEAKAAAQPPPPAAGAFAKCTSGWEITGYFTPVEEDYSGDTEEISVAGFGSENFAAAFLKEVRMEGWGRTRFSWYLGYGEKGYRRGNFAEDALGQQLVLGSVAVDRHEIPFGTQLTIPNLPDEWGRRVYQAVDVGGAINQKHIDVYCGEGAEAKKITNALTIQKPAGARVCLA